MTSWGERNLLTDRYSPGIRSGTLGTSVAFSQPRSKGRRFPDEPDLDVEFASKHEPNWETYRTALYPTPEDWQVIGNHRVLEQLREAGDTLTKPRRVVHWAYFPSAKDRASFVKNLDGFEADEMSKDDAEDGLPYALCFSHTTSVEPGGINSVTVQLMRLVSAKGGVYDGWETSVEPSEQAPEKE